MAANVAATNCGQQTSNSNASKRNDELETKRTTATKASLSASSTGNRIDNPRPLDDISNGNDVASATDVIVVYDVEHLATFSTAATTTNGSHETATNNGRSKQQVNNDSKTKPQALADDHDDNDDPATAAAKAAASVESGRTGYGGECGNVLAGRSKAAAFDSCIDSITTPKVALRRLFELEKLSGIWTQRMQIELRHDSMLIVDCETNSVVEKFDKTSVTKPEAFNEYNHIYNNIVVFIIRQQQQHIANDKENAHSSKANANSNKNDDDDNVDDQIEGELHIFQCVSQQAQQLVQDIQDWKSSKLQQQVRRAATTQQTSSNRHSGSGKQTTSEMAKLIINSGISSKCNNHDDDSDVKTKVAPSSAAENNGSNSKLKSNKQQAATDSPRAASKPVVTVASSSSANENVPVVNVNVKETVQVFNQIAALREKR